MNKIIRKIALVALLPWMIASCRKTPSAIETTPKAEETTTSTALKEKHDYAHDGSIVLGLDYKNKNFFRDGISQVYLKSPIDGDTAHFYTSKDKSSSQIVKSRFYGIDTPESTGKVEPYGKPASNFTKEKLKNAAEKGTIVVSAPIKTYQEPMTDTTGSRYLSMIWINETVKDAPYDSLTLLNLWIVQEGFSVVKALDKMPSYKETFLAAEQQAKDLKLNMHSGEPDPLFNYGSYVDTSILDLKRDMEKTMTDKDYQAQFDNAKVRITGTVAGYANGSIYLQAFFAHEQYPEAREVVENPVTHQMGEYASINIYGQAAGISDIFTKRGSYLSIPAVCSYDEQFGYQLHGANFSPYSEDERDVQVLLTASENIEENQFYSFDFENTSDFKVGTLDYMNCSVSFAQPLHISRVRHSGDDPKSGFSFYTEELGNNIEIYLPFNYAGNPASKMYFYTQEDFESNRNGFKLNAGVYCYRKDSNMGKIYYEIIPSVSADLVDMDYAL
jgi:endonuclease YncB( thermonuclease family)